MLRAERVEYRNNDASHPQKRRGLVLSGGGAKGAFEFGCLQALADANLKFDAVAGTSVGSLNAVLFATKSLDEGSSIWAALSFATTYPLRRSILALLLGLLSAAHFVLSDFVNASRVRHTPLMIAIRLLVVAIVIGPMIPFVLVSSFVGLPDASQVEQALTGTILATAWLAVCPRHQVLPTLGVLWLGLGSVTVVAIISALWFTRAWADILPIGFVLWLFFGINNRRSLVFLYRRSIGTAVLLYLLVKIAIALALLRPSAGTTLATLTLVWPVGLSFISLGPPMFLNYSALDPSPLRKQMEPFLRKQFTMPCFATKAKRLDAWDPDSTGSNAFEIPPEGIIESTNLFFQRCFVPAYDRIDRLPAAERLDAVSASAALPFGIVPNILGYIDGGIIDNTPILPLLNLGELDEIWVVALDRVFDRQAIERKVRAIETLLLRERITARVCDWQHHNREATQSEILAFARTVSSEAQGDPERIHIRCSPVIIPITPPRDLGGFFSGTLRFSSRYAQDLMECGRTAAHQKIASYLADQVDT